MDFPIKDKDLPAIFRQVVINAPANRKVPSFVACLSPLCALATRIRLKYYYDSRSSALLLQVIIEGSQSVGKSFAAIIERLLMDSTLKLRDKQQRLIEQEYREKKKRRKDGPSNERRGNEARQNNSEKQESPATEAYKKPNRGNDRNRQRRNGNRPRNGEQQNSQNS